MNLQALAERPFELLLELERRARVAIAAREGAPAPADEWVGIGFRLGAERFVTSRADVREVLPIPEQVTRVPGAKPWLRGIANLRGQLLTVVDLKSFLGAGAPAAEQELGVDGADGEGDGVAGGVPPVQPAAAVGAEAALDARRRLIIAQRVRRRQVPQAALRHQVRVEDQRARLPPALRALTAVALRGQTV